MNIRAGAVGLLALSATLAFSQGGIIHQSLRALQERGKLPLPIVNDPLQPTGFGPAAGDVKVGKLPEKDPNRQEFKVLRAGQSHRNGDNIEIVDGVEFEFRGYHVFADEAVGNLDSSIFRLTGNVRVIGKESTVSARAMTINVNEESFIGEYVNSELKPSLLNGQLRSSMYIRGEEGFGTRAITTVVNGGVTTCDLPHPHFELTGRDVTVIPNRYVIFRNANFELFGKSRFRIPYLLIPLDDRSNKYTPEVGQSPDEGYYIKNRFAIPLRGMSSTLVSRFDYMSKLGFGLGGDYTYQTRTMSGIIKAYKIFGTAKTLTLNNSHRQEFRWGSFSLDNDYQRDNYLSAPGSTILSTRANLVIPGKNGDGTRLSYAKNGNSSAGFGSSYQTVSLNDTRKFGPRIRTNLDINWTTNTSQSQGTPSTNRQQIDVRFRADNDFNRGSATLEYQRSIPVGNVPNFFSGADRTPVFTLSSDAAKLVGQKFASNLPFQTELSLGEFNDPQKRNQITRYYFNFGFQRNNRGRGKLKWDLSGRFRQGIYSDNTAQYVVEYGTTLSYGFGRDTAATVRYNMLKPAGFAPLQIDRFGRSNLATFDVNYRPTKRALVAIQTGYDFQSVVTNQPTSWQQIAARTEYQVDDKFLFRGLYGYDTIRQVWNNVRLDLTAKSKATIFGVGARFDGFRHTWTNVNIFLENLTVGRMKFSAVWNYNGFTRRFDTQQYSMIYDLHCAEAVLTWVESATGFRAGREINFYIRLKALPSDTPFGIGRRGQPVNYNLGSG